MQPQRQEKVRRRCARGIRKTPCLFHPTFCCVVVYLMVPGLCGSVCVYAQWLAPLTASHSFGKYRFVLFWFIFLFLFVWRTVPSICTAAESSGFSLRPKLTEALNIYRPGPIDTFHFCRVFSLVYTCYFVLAATRSFHIDFMSGARLSDSPIFESARWRCRQHFWTVRHLCSLLFLLLFFKRFSNIYFARSEVNHKTGTNNLEIHRFSIGAHLSLRTLWVSMLWKEIKVVRRYRIRDRCHGWLSLSVYV